MWNLKNNTNELDKLNKRLINIEAKFMVTIGKREGGDKLGAVE